MSLPGDQTAPSEEVVDDAHLNDPNALKALEEDSASLDGDLRAVRDDEEGSPQGSNDEDDGEADEAGSENEEVDDDDNEDNEDDEDNEEADADSPAAGRRQKSSKSKRKRESKGKSKSKKRRQQAYHFFNDYAEEGDDDEEEPEERELEDIVATKDEQAAIDAVERRHARMREMQAKTAEELASRFEDMDRQEQMYERRRKELEESGIGARPSQQSLLPKVTDPKIFKVKCRQGQEQIAIRSLLLKSLDMQKKDGFFKVKSAFCGDIKGFIYVEAISETFAKEVVGGLKMIFFSSFAQVPIPDMPAVLAVTAKKKPLQVGQWVRIKRGPLKGDLARIIQLYEGGAKAFVQAIPRPDYTAENNKKGTTTALGTTSRVRPPQRLFDAEQARAASNGNVFRRYHPDVRTDRAYDVWENEYYQDGFLFKMVNTATFLSESAVEPKLEELQIFLNNVKQATNSIVQSDLDDRDRDQDEFGGERLFGSQTNKSLNQELTEQIQIMESENNSGLAAFVPGDFVLVVGGELQNLVAKVTSIDEIRKVAKVVSADNRVEGEFEVEWDLLVKHITAGAHVKVMKGRYIGQTGRVVSVMVVDGTQTAAILTDGLKTDIQCNVSFLQQSNEVATGLGSLMGYELYDLVLLNENESAVVINVMLERLRVLNHLSNVKDVAPQEIRSKQNLFSSRSKSYDAQQNVISVGDTMSVLSGPHAKLSGTIKHILKGTLWLHSDSYLKNSGVFVVKARNCVVAGGKNGGATTSLMMGGMAGGLRALGNKPGATSQHGSAAGTPGGGMAQGGSRMGRDPLLNKMVRIRRGAYKSLLAQVVDATSAHYSVELLAKMKKVVVAKDDVLLVTGRPEEGRGGFGFGADVMVPDTPYLTSSTPAHMLGAETPNYAGGETPAWSGSMTPYGQDSYGDALDMPYPPSTTNSNLLQTPHISDTGDTPAYMMHTPSMGASTPAGAGAGPTASSHAATTVAAGCASSGGDGGLLGGNGSGHQEGRADGSTGGDHGECRRAGVLLCQAPRRPRQTQPRRAQAVGDGDRFGRAAEELACHCAVWKTFHSHGHGEGGSWQGCAGCLGWRRNGSPQAQYTRVAARQAQLRKKHFPVQACNYSLLYTCTYAHSLTHTFSLLDMRFSSMAECGRNDCSQSEKTTCRNASPGLERTADDQVE